MTKKRTNQLGLVSQVFEYEQFGKIRVVMIDGKPYFVAVDLCRALGYSNTRDALARHVDSEDKNTVVIRDGIPGNPNMVVVNESGMYALIFGSQLPAAKKFKRWVTNEVLPSIRETGSYSVPKKKKELPTLPPDFFDKAKNDYEKVAMLEQFLEDNNVEYDYELKPKIIEDENGEPALCYSFSLVIKDE